MPLDDDIIRLWREFPNPPWAGSSDRVPHPDITLRPAADKLLDWMIAHPGEVPPDELRFREVVIGKRQTAGQWGWIWVDDEKVIDLQARFIEPFAEWVTGKVGAVTFLTKNGKRKCAQRDAVDAIDVLGGRVRLDGGEKWRRIVGIEPVTEVKSPVQPGAPKPAPARGNTGYNDAEIVDRARVLYGEMSKPAKYGAAKAAVDEAIKAGKQIAGQSRDAWINRVRRQI